MSTNIQTSDSCRLETADGQSCSESLRANSQFRIRPVFVLGLVCAIVFFFRLGTFGILEGGESYYPAAVREMLEARDWLVPRLNYQLYFSKPILTFWLIGSAYSMFGINEMAARFWSAFFSSALVFVTYWTARSVSNERGGMLSALILASCPLLIGTCTRSSIDIFFSFFITSAIYGVIVTLFAGRRNCWWMIYASLALAVLTKGPAALVLVALGVGAFLLVRRPSLSQMGTMLKALHPIAGICIFSAIVLPWFSAIAVATKGLFLKVFLIYENVGRFAGHATTKRTFVWWYATTFLYGFLPWCIYFPPVAVRCIRNGLRERTPQSEAVLMSFCSAVAILIFFSFSKTQFDTYVLPAWGFLALCSGITLNNMISQAEAGVSRDLWLGRATIATAVIGIAAFIVSIVAAVKVHELEPWMRFFVPAATAILTGGWLSAAWNWQKGRFSTALYRGAIATCISLGLLAPIGFHVWYQAKFAAADNLAASLANTNGQVTQFRDYMFSLLYYRRGPVDYFFGTDDVVPLKSATASDRRGAHQPLLVITAAKFAPELLQLKTAHFKILSREGEYLLLQSNDAIVRRPATLEAVFHKLTVEEMLTWKLEQSPPTMPFGGGDLPQRLQKLTQK